MHAYLFHVKTDDHVLDEIINKTKSNDIFEESVPSGVPGVGPLHETYEYQWKIEFNKFNIGIPDDSECYHAVAKIEFPRRIKVRTDGTLMPRSERINVNYPDVLLFKDEDQTYLAIITSYLPDIKRVCRLFGEDRVEKLQPSQYLTDSFFVWIYYHFSKEKPILSDLKLNNIEGFTGIISDPSNTVVGNSDDTANLIITKAFVSNHYPLKSLKLNFFSKSLMALMVLTEEKEVSIDVPKTKFLLQSIDDANEVSLASIAFIYIYLLPKLLKKYHDEKEVFKKDNISFSKEIGLDVVNAIIRKNNISLEDLKINNHTI